jgi:sulfatase maturation enzyme AslB (radical SAM superfamily)
MANKDIFCAVPWHNSHLYWDGTYGACCSERVKPLGEQKNIKDTNIVQWYNSDTMRNFRLRILGDEKLPECQGCYHEEQNGHESRRIRENFKVAIFTKQAFQKSFAQTNWYSKFLHSSNLGDTDSLPIDIHLDFGNECNLACKMCNPNASSRISNYYNKWHITSNKFDNWTNSDSLYQKLLDNIKLTPKLNRIHIMGGEPTINKRFYSFIDWLIENNYKDLSFSFVSNGTIINEELIKKLQFFKSSDVEISLESIHSNNHYIRQGSQTTTVLNNIFKLLEYKSSTFNIVLRSVPQLLSVNNYNEYIEFAHKHNLSIQSVPLLDPEYLSIKLLPYKLKQQLTSKYQQTKKNILSNTSSFQTLTVGRDTSRLDQQLVKECDTVISMLNEPEPENVVELRSQLVTWMMRWDKVFDLNAFTFFPEYKEFLQDCGYRI